MKTFSKFFLSLVLVLAYGQFTTLNALGEDFETYGELYEGEINFIFGGVSEPNRTNRYGINLEYKTYDENGYSTLYSGELVLIKLVLENTDYDNDLDDENYDLSLTSAHSIVLPAGSKVIESTNSHDIPTNVVVNDVERNVVIDFTSGIDFKEGTVFEFSAIVELDHEYTAKNWMWTYNATVLDHYEGVGINAQSNFLINRAPSEVKISKALAENGNGNGVLEIGETADYEITIANMGASDLYNYTLYDTLLREIAINKTPGIEIVGEPVVEQVSDYENPIFYDRHENLENGATLKDGVILIPQLEAGASLEGRSAPGDVYVARYTLKITEDLDPKHLNLVNIIHEKDDLPTDCVDEEGNVIDSTTEGAQINNGGDNALCTVIPTNVNITPTVDDDPALPATGNINYATFIGLLALMAYVAKDKVKNYTL